MTSLKEKLGFGFLRSEDEVMVEDLAKTARPKSKFDNAMSYIITNLLMQLVVPWIQSCFEKYSEADFHQQMAANFDFIADWKTNHEERFAQFIRIAKRLRHRFQYDEYAIYNEVMKIFDKKRWDLLDFEKMRLLITISNLKEMIMKD